MQGNMINLIRSGLILAAAVVLSNSLMPSPAAAQKHAHQHDMSSAGAEDAAALMDSLTGIDIDFELVGRDGALIRDDDFRGRYVLIGFGFTRCTDVCPLMALNMARVLQAIEQPAAGVFISVDTERDAPEAVDNYTRAFDERIVGLSGSVEQINTTVKNFNAKYVVTKSQDGVTVQHTSHIYAIDPEGRLIDVFAFMTPTEEIAAAME
jgi:protein SCO1/2